MAILFRKGFIDRIVALAPPEPSLGYTYALARSRLYRFSRDGGPVAVVAEKKGLGAPKHFSLHGGAAYYVQSGKLFKHRSSGRRSSSRTGSRRPFGPRSKRPFLGRTGDPHMGARDMVHVLSVRSTKEEGADWRRESCQR